VADVSSPYALAPEVRERIAKMLTLVAKEVRQCKRCRRTIYMLPMAKTGKLNPFTDDGVSHFSDCPHAEDFR
jgi:Glu-tRNA(Gln) amidotransferase subunit E-like FAD-binding protein